MKIRSKNLFLFLQQQGLLDKSPAEIEAGKRLYRKIYRQNWRKANAGKIKEIRPGFSAAEYDKICLRADLHGMSVAEYTRQLLLDHIGEGKLIPEPDTLRRILQLISMATISLERYRDIPQFPAHLKDQLWVQISQAEQLFIKYLGK